MLSDRQTRAMLAICTTILVAAALYFARSIFAPLAFAIFMVALVWPLQRALETKLPQAVALLLTLLLTVAVVVAVSSMVTWALSVERAWLVGHAARFQTIYAEWARWLEEHEIFVVGPLTERFDVMWLVRLFQTLVGHINTLVGFAVLAFVFLMLALMETGDFRERLALASKQAKGPDFAEVGEEIAAKIRKYMIVRTQMSVLTGLAVWAWALFSGLELAPAWGIIAFVVNYIPFIGSFIATLLPSLFAVAQFGTLHDSLFVFLGMFAIQFAIGNYLEPLVAGAALSISPLAVVFAVFFFGFLWGMPGAFLGVPILIAILMLCAHYPSTSGSRRSYQARQNLVSRMKSRNNRGALGKPFIDPRRGDVETDVSSTKQHSMLSLAGGLLVEISLPKLFMAWTLLLVVPGLLLGLAPIAISDWVRTLSDSIATLAIGLWSILVLTFVLALGWFGWRTLFRLVENSFWALNSVVVQPGYAATREVLRQIAENLFAKRGSKDQYAKLRAASAIAAGLLICAVALLVLYLVYPSAELFGSFAEIGGWRSLIGVALANSVVLIMGYLAIGALIWGVADATTAQPRDLTAFEERPAGAKTWRVVHLSDVHVVGERYGFRIESGRSGPRGNERLKRVLAELEAIHAKDPARSRPDQRRHDRRRHPCRMGRVPRRHGGASQSRRARSDPSRQSRSQHRRSC